jgi:hypothetical protein
MPGVDGQLARDDRGLGSHTIVEQFQQVGELQRYARALELLVDVGVVGLEVACRARHRGAVQPRLEFFVAERLGDGPVHAGSTRESRELAHRRLRNTQRPAGLGVAEACFKVQA